MYDITTTTTKKLGPKGVTSITENVWEEHLEMEFIPTPSDKVYRPVKSRCARLSVLLRKGDDVRIAPLAVSNSEQTNFARSLEIPKTTRGFCNGGDIFTPFGFERQINEWFFRD
jgi:hypothetical protein